MKKGEWGNWGRGGKRQRKQDGRLMGPDGRTEKRGEGWKIGGEDL